MVLCVWPGHPLAKRNSIGGTELHELPMVLFDASFIQRAILDKLCRKTRAKPRVVLESNSVPLIRQAVVDRLGASTLLRSLADWKPRLVAIPFEASEILHFSLCWRDDRYLSKANRAFVEFAKKLEAESVP